MARRFLPILLLWLLAFLFASNVYAQTTARLSNFVRQVWQYNPRLQSAKADIATAKADKVASGRPIYNPNLELEGEHVNKDAEEDTYTAGISQTIDWGNQRGAQYQLGGYQLIAAQRQFDQERLQLGIETLQTLVRYRTRLDILQLAKRRTALLHRFAEQTENKFKAGDVAQDAWDLSRLAYSEAISQQADAAFLLNEAKQNLIAITQLPVLRWPILPGILPHPVTTVSTNKRMQLIMKLPRIQLLNTEVNAANAAMKIAQTQTYANPTVTLSGGAEDSKPLIRLGVNIPLFVRNNFKAQVVAANHNITAVEKRRLNAYQQVKAQLTGTMQRYQALYGAYQQWTKVSKHSLDGGVQLLNRLWSEGELSTTDYLIQLKQRIDAQIAGSQLQGETWQAWFAWLNASGQLNQWLKN